MSKLSTRAAIFLSLTSMLGAGIFIKVRTLNTLAHNHATPIVFVFLLFFASMFAFSYVLKKIIPSQTRDMGFLEWSKNFCEKHLHLDFCRFVRHIYYPVSFFLFATYGVLGITQRQLGVFSTLGLAFIVVLVFVVINFFSFEWSRKIQIGLSVLTAAPLFILPFIGFISPGITEEITHEAQVERTFWSSEDGSKATGLESLGPWMILLSGLPSLLFIYDGFYGITALKSKLKNPDKLNIVILAAMGIVTLVYLYVIIGFNIGDPKYANFKNFRLLSKKYVAIDVFDLLICSASFMTLNSIVMGYMPQLRAIQEVHRFWDVEKTRSVIFYRREFEDYRFEEKFSILLVILCKTLICFMISGAVMFFMTQYNWSQEPVEIVHALADIVTLCVFLILLFIVRGSYKQNKTLFYEDKRFRWCSIVSGTVILVSLAYLLLSYIIGTTGYAGSDIFSSWVKLIILVIFSLICFWPRILSFFCCRFSRKKQYLYPSYDKDNIITLE